MEKVEQRGWIIIKVSSSCQPSIYVRLYVTLPVIYPPRARGAGLGLVPLSPFPGLEAMIGWIFRLLSVTDIGGGEVLRSNGDGYRNTEEPTHILTTFLQGCGSVLFARWELRSEYYQFTLVSSEIKLLSYRNTYRQFCLLNQLGRRQWQT